MPPLFVHCTASSLSHPPQGPCIVLERPSGRAARLAGVAPGRRSGSDRLPGRFSHVRRRGRPHRGAVLTGARRPIGRRRLGAHAAGSAARARCEGGISVEDWIISAGWFGEDEGDQGSELSDTMWRVVGWLLRGESV